MLALSVYFVHNRVVKEKKIDKGQLIVETNGDKRYMEARVTNPKVVPMLYGKYKTDVFLKFEQLTNIQF